jgi:hypothetical protein
MAQTVVALRGGIALRIGGVDAVDLSGFENLLASGDVTARQKT